MQMPDPAGSGTVRSNIGRPANITYSLLGPFHACCTLYKPNDYDPGIWMLPRRMALQSSTPKLDG